MPSSSSRESSSEIKKFVDKTAVHRNSSIESANSRYNHDGNRSKGFTGNSFSSNQESSSSFRENGSGLSITMKTPHMKKEGNSEIDPKSGTRIDFGDFFPEGGWGWMVTISATLVYILCNGFHYAFGTLYLCFQQWEEKVDDMNAVWLGTIGVSITMFMSPVVSTVCQRKSPRLYAVIGGLICSLGCLFLAFSEKIEQFFISHCVVLSVGSGMTINTANIIVGRYFHRKRELAEVIMNSGTGIGAAVMAVLFKELCRIFKKTNTLQCISGIMVLTIVAGSLYRSATMYHPRRKVIMHIKNQKKSRRERDDEDRTYFDFNALRMRGLQALMVISSIAAFGMYTPFILLLKTGHEKKMEFEMLLLLNIYLGIGYLIGCISLGYIIVRDSKECSICRRHLCQSCCIGCGILTLLLLMAQDFNSYALYAWGFGIFCGGYFYTLKMYTYELVKFKIMERAWGFVCVAQFIPFLVGSPISLYLNEIYSNQAGFMFAGVSMLLAGLLFFLMPPFEKHKSNLEVIQLAKNSCSKNSTEAAALLDLDLTEAMVTKPLNNVQFIVSPSRLKHSGKEGGKIQMQCFIHHKEKEKPKQIVLSKITEEKEGLRLDFNEVSHSSLASKVNDSSSQSRGDSCKFSAHGQEFPSDSLHSNHTGKSSSESNSLKSEGKKLKKTMDNVKVELFDPPSQEKESTATVSYDSDLYINLCEAQV